MHTWYRPAPLVLFVLALLLGSVLAAQEIEATVVIKNNAWLGVYLGDAEQVHGWNQMEGAVVQEVVKDGPADKAGLRAGDTIIKLQDRTIRDADDVTRDIHKMKPGDVVEIQVLREGKKTTLKAKLQEREVKREMAMSPERKERERRIERVKEQKSLPGFWGQPGRRMGVQLQEMDADLAEYFEVKEGEGVLVSAVEEQSAAETAGLKSGDVLVAINDMQVNNLEDVREALGKAESNEHKITYKRKGQTENATVILEKGEVRNFQFRFGGDEWPFSGETLRDLREDLEELKEELEELKIKLDIEVETK